MNVKHREGKDRADTFQGAGRALFINPARRAHITIALASVTLCAAGLFLRPEAPEAAGQSPAAPSARIVLPIGLLSAAIPRAIVPTALATASIAAPTAGPTSATPPPVPPMITASPTAGAPSRTPVARLRTDALLAPLSPRHLRLALGEDDPGEAPDVLDWRITSKDDPAYAEALPPMAIASRSSASALIPIGWPFPAVVAHEVLLQLPAPMRAESTYRVIHEPSARTWEIALDADEVWTPSVHVNAVGFKPGASGDAAHPETAHYAYVSSWLAGLPAMVLADTERAYSVVNVRDGTVAHSGRLELRMAHDAGGEDAYDANYTGANVYEADLGTLSPGEYYVRWEPVGRTFSFEVGATVLDDAFESVFRGLFHQRCGTALDPTITPWSHAICHIAPVELTTADIHITGSDAFTALPSMATGEIVNVTGGYHDAGDYDRRASHLQVVDSLVDLFEIVPFMSERDDLGLPESGNDRSDLLDEALWALDLYAQLQGETGGVRAGVETTGYPDWGMMPEDDTATAWYAYGEDARSSYRFAGAAAKLARALQPTEAGLAEEWLERAERAWEWAEANPPEAYDASALGAYGSAELLKTTGQVRYETALAAHAPLIDDPAAALPPWDNGRLMPALWALVTAEGAGAERRANGLRAFQSRIETLTEWYPRSAHRWAKHPYAPVGYGSLTTPAQAGWILRAHHLSRAGDESARRNLFTIGAHALDYQLGANPTGRSWVTGLGENAVRYPLQNPSLGDDIEEPVPGIPVYGPSHEVESDGILGFALGAFRPPAKEWPPAERFVDVSYVPIYNEFTVAESMAPTIFVTGYLVGVDR